jgi:hypothetical protein
MHRLCLLALAAGCSGAVNYGEQTGQRLAVRVVWNETYSMMAPAPTLGWVNQASLNCNKEDGHYNGFKIYNGDCVWGVTWTAAKEVWLAHPAPEYTSFSWNGVLAHELLHYSLFLNTGDADVDHKDPGFGTLYGHPAGGAIDQADAALVAAGL